MSNQTDRSAAISDSLGSQPTNYESAFHQYWDDAGIPPGEFNQRFVAWARDATGLDSWSLPSLQAEIAKQVGVGSWNEVGSEFADILSRAKYYFDGTTYATLNTPWAANGKPREWELNFNCPVLATGAIQCLLSGEEGGISMDILLAADSNQLVLRYRSSTGAAAYEVVSTPLLVAGEDTKIEIITLGAGSELYINGVPGEIGGFPAGDSLQPPITHIGCKHDLTEPFTGEIWGVGLTDDTPIQGDFYNIGNNATYGTLDTPIALTSDDFYIKFNWRREANNGLCYLYSDSTGLNLGAIRLYNNDHASWPDAISLLLGGNRLDFGIAADASQSILNGIDYGQDIVVEIIAGDTIQILINGVEPPQSPNNLANPRVPWNIDRLFTNYNASNKIANGTFSDFVIQQGGVTYSYPLTEVDGDSTLIENTTIVPLFFDPAAAVKGEGTCLDKFSGTASNAMGDLTVNSLGGNTAVTDFNSTKGFRPGPTDSMGWLTYDADAFHNGFTMYMEVESFIFADDFVNPVNDTGCLMYSGGGFGKAMRFDNITEAWNANGEYDPADSIKTRADELPEFVGVYFTYIPTVGTRCYIEEVLVQEYADTGVPNTVSPMGLPGFGDVYNLSAYRRNLVLWQEPLDLSTVDAPAVYYLGDSFTQWGNYQSGNLSNTTTDDDPNNNPPAGWQGVTTDSPYYDAKYELKNESTVAQFHRTFAEKNYNPTIYFYGEGGATITDRSPNIVGAGILEARVDAALDTGDTGILMPAGGEAGRCDIWVSQIGTNDINFAMIDDPNTPDSFFDGMIPIYQAQIDRMIDDGARHIMVCNITPRYTETGQPQWPSQVNYVNRLYAEHIDGYRDMVTLVDVFTGWDFSMTDGLDPGNENHPGPKGQRRIADRVGAALPVFSPAWSAFNGRWTAPNFEYIAANSRKYRMDEGSGLVLEDSLHPDEIDYYATLSSETGWPVDP